MAAKKKTAGKLVGPVGELQHGTSKKFTIGRARLQANLDLYNALNASSVLNQTTRYGAAWQDVVQIMGGRMLKLGAQFDF